MDIPLGAKVRCKDGICGQSTYLVMNPITQEVTHVVVREAAYPHVEHLLPTSLITATTPETVDVSCTTDELVDMEAFKETQFKPADAQTAALIYGSTNPEEGILLWPYVEPENMLIPVEHKRVPPGELAVRRGAHVEATDGGVGRVDAFLVDPGNCHITHLVLREGHLWNQKDVTIPVSHIDHVEEGTVYLRLDKKSIGTLPSIPLRRRY